MQVWYWYVTSVHSSVQCVWKLFTFYVLRHEIIVALVFAIWDSANLLSHNCLKVSFANKMIRNIYKNIVYLCLYGKKYYTSSNIRHKDKIVGWGVLLSNSLPFVKDPCYNRGVVVPNCKANIWLIGTH